MRKYLFFLVIILLLAMGCQRHSQPVAVNQTNVLPDGRLEISSPKANDVIDMSFIVNGYAQGFFEGTVPLKVIDANNHILYASSFVVGDNYENPKSFSANISLTTKPSSETGTIEFYDSSQKDGSIIYQKNIPIRFSKNNILDTSSWTTATSTVYGYAIQYPADFSYAANKNQLKSVSYIPVCNDGFAGCIYYSGTNYKGTNFEAAGVSLAIQKNYTTEAKCYDFKIATNEAQTDAGTVAINGAIFHIATGGGGGAGHYDKVKVYRTYYNGSCYELNQSLASTNVANYEPGTIKQFNENEVWDKLQNIINTFKFTNVSHDVIPSTAPMSVSGTTVCLPYAGATPGQPETMECAIGLRETKTGKYYGLKNYNSFDTGKKVQIIGNIESAGNSNYDIIGIINVISFQ